MSNKTDITLYFLNSSRAIRIAWLLEELDLSYELVAANRHKTGTAPPELKAKIPNPMGKSPCIKDGDLVLVESGAIAEYLIEKYDTKSQLLPSNPHHRASVREWIHAAEGTFMMHGLAILYARWKIPESTPNRATVLADTEAGMSVNVTNDLNWLEGVLKAQSEKGNSWIVGDGASPTAADVMMGFSVEFLFERKLGNPGWRAGRWEEVEAWWGRVKEWSAYQKAVQRTGYTLDGDFKK